MSYGINERAEDDMRVAFSLIGHKGWTGGSHYLKNILSALQTVTRGSIEPVLFSGENKQAELDAIRQYVADVVTTRSFTEWSPSWIMRQVLRRMPGNDRIAARLFDHHDVKVVFHAGLFGPGFHIPCVNWIADFQHFHLPGMFTERERVFRTRLMREYAKQSKRLVVSSQDARKDFETFFPDYQTPVDILRFVVPIQPDIYNKDPRDAISSYRLPEKFFYLPNQFWKHKNHIVVLEALHLLKKRNENVFVICTGNENDHRNPGHFGDLKRIVQQHNLQDQIAFLGLVPLPHVYAFMRQSIAVLNPSFFEGWSTTVEEVKSLGKRILLSDIPVHREQAPGGGAYFDPGNAEDLADKLMRTWEETAPGPDLLMEEQARSLLQSRIQSFGETFADILRKAI